MTNKQLKFWRTERGLSQQELALASGVPRFRLSLIEQGLSALSELEAQRVFSILLPENEPGDNSGELQSEAHGGI